MKNKRIFFFSSARLAILFACSCDMPAIWLRQCCWRNISRWQCWLPHDWRLQGGELTAWTTPRDCPLHGMLPLCQPIICGRTNVRSQMFFSAAGSSSPGPATSQGRAYCQELHWISFPSPQSFPCSVYIALSSTRWKFCWKQGNSALPFESLWMSAWGFTFCRCSRLMI